LIENVTFRRVADAGHRNCRHCLASSSGIGTGGSSWATGRRVRGLADAHRLRVSWSASARERDPHGRRETGLPT
jgi:hypothetical protein